MKAKDYVLMGIVGAGAAIAGFIVGKLLSDKKANEIKEGAEKQLEEDEDDFDFGGIDESSKAKKYRRQK